MVERSEGGGLGTRPIAERMERAEEDRLSAHVFTELVGLQMLLMGLLFAAVPRPATHPGAISGTCPQRAVRQRKAGKELLAQRLGQEEK